MNHSTKESGITLISLTVMLIVIIVLAGVSVTTFYGGDGLVRRTEIVAQKHEIENEREILTNNVIEAQLEKDKQLGDPLQLESDSDVIVQGSETYGKGWNYIAKDTMIDENTKTSYSWVVNYTSGEVVCLGEETFDRS